MTLMSTIQRRAAALMAALILIASVGFVVSRSARPAGADTVFASGQIFASVGGSQVFTYDPTSGLYLNALTDSSLAAANLHPDIYTNGFLTVGSAFDEAPGPSYGDFFVTDDDTLGDSNSQVSEFAPNGTQVATFPGLANPISIAFDGNGDMFVGQQLTAKIAEFDPTPGTAANASAPANWTRQTDLGTAPADPIQIETSGGPDSIDMSSDQHTIYYTSEGTEVFTYDKSAGQQGPIFNKIPLPLSQVVTDVSGYTHTVNTNAYAVKILGTPGYVGDVLVADAADVVLFDPNGNVIKTYPCSSFGDGCDYKLFSLSVDPSGTSFWTGDQNTGNIYQVDIATGNVLKTIDGIQAGTSGNLFGLSIDNQLEVASSPQSTAPPPAPVISTPTVSGTFVYGQPTQVSAVVTDTTGTPIATGSVTFTLGGDSCTASPDNNGLAMCSITPGGPSGSYTLMATYSSNTSSGSTTAVTAASEVPTLLNTDQTAVTYTGPTSVVNGQTFSPSATVVDTTTNTPVVPGGQVTFTVGSGPTAQSFTCGTDASGVVEPCTSPIISQTTSNPPVTVSYAGSPYNMPTPPQPIPGLFTVWEPTALTVAGGQVDYADTITLSATLKDTFSTNPIANEPVAFTLSDGTVPCPQSNTDANGVAYCQITPSGTESAGTYILSANFGGAISQQLQFMSASGSANVKVTPEETAITYTGQTVAVNGTPFTMSANLTRGVGPGLPAETDTVPLGGKTVLLTLGPLGSQQSCTGTTDSAGNASCTITPVGQPLGTIPVTAQFAGDQYYSPKSNGSNVNVPEGTQLTINSTPPLVYNTPSPVSATLTTNPPGGPPGPVQPGEVVTFELNNNSTQTCQATTNASGVASCLITPNEPAGSYSVSASFPGDSGSMPQLLPNASSSTISVTQAPTTLSYTGTTSVTNGQPATLSGVVTQTSSGTDVPNQTVTFTLGSGNSWQSCTATTLPNGVASCTIASVNQTSSGSVGISASSSGDQWYASSTTASSATVHSPTTLTLTTGGGSEFADAITVQATLTTTNSPKPIANEPVAFMLSDGTVPCPAAMTNASGVASCPITPTEKAGTYSLTATFAGDNPVGLPQLQATSGSGSFVVSLEESAIAYTGPSIAVSGMSFTMSAHLTRGAVDTGETDNVPLSGKSVLMTLGSGSTAQFCTGTTDSAGNANCPIANVNQIAGTVPISVTFAGDAYYQPATAAGIETTAAAPSGGGGFVVGDVSAGLPTPINGTTVNFWGAQLWKTNQFSGVNNAPASMKGYIDNAPNYACGAAWTSDPGNSSHPPATIPVNMVVVVASAINKSGSTESGNILHLVVVSVNPGYGPAPGHDAWGKIIATIC